MRVLGWIVGIVVVGFAGLMLLGAILPRETGQDAVNRIDASCDREYGTGTDQASQCKVALYEKRVDQIEGEKAKRAARGAGF